MVHLIGRNKQAAFAEFLRRSYVDLPDFIRPIRDKTVADSRPNKASEIHDHLLGWASYGHRTRWEAILRHGGIPHWNSEVSSQRRPPQNHSSLPEALTSAVKNLLKDHDKVQYWILDIDLLSEQANVTCSPFGTAQNGDAPFSEDARIIHDLSFPEGYSVNDLTANSLHIAVVVILARRILEVRAQVPGLVKVLSGDVTGTFRNSPIHADHVGRFAGVIRELGIQITDLSCPFGWSDSPHQYWPAGGATSIYVMPACPAGGGNLISQQEISTPKHGVTTITVLSRMLVHARSSYCSPALDDGRGARA